MKETQFHFANKINGCFSDPLRKKEKIKGLYNQQFLSQHFVCTRVKDARTA